MGDKTQRAGQPLVSVALITYNHRAFIREAIDSVLMQEYEGNIELIVADDCSTDGTTAIVREYVACNPGKIRHLLAEKNKGAHKNVQDALESCTGKYTALLEGDDYWTDKSKIAEQVRILEFDKDASAVGHPVRLIGRRSDNVELKVTVWPVTSKRILALEDALVRHSVPTASLMFRSEALPEYPPWATSAGVGDWPIVLSLAEHGHIHFLPECMAVNRLHENGSWSQLSAISRLQKTRDIYLAVRKRYGTWHGPLIAEAMYENTIAGIRHLDASEGASRQEVCRELEKTILACARIGYPAKVAECRLWARLRFPRLYGAWSKIKGRR